MPGSRGQGENDLPKCSQEEAQRLGSCSVWMIPHTAHEVLGPLAPRTDAADVALMPDSATSLDRESRPLWQELCFSSEEILPSCLECVASALREKRALEKLWLIRSLVPFLCPSAGLLS